MWIMWTEAEFISVTLVCHLCWEEILKRGKTCSIFYMFSNTGRGIRDVRLQRGNRTKKTINLCSSNKKETCKQEGHNMGQQELL